MNYERGLCLVPKDSTAKKYGKIVYGACSGNGARWRKEPTADGSFHLQHFETGYCVVTKSTKPKKDGVFYFKDCDTAGTKSEFTEVFNNDGSLYLKSTEDGSFCLTSAGTVKTGSGIEWHTGCPSNSKNNWMMVDGEGPMTITKYEAKPTPNAGTLWYTDPQSTKLTDGEHNSDFNSATSNVGVGWITHTAITVDLETAGPIQTVVLGYDVKESWKVYVPD